MPESYSSIESRISSAINALENEEKPNLAKIARDYRVPYHRLRARYKGRQSRSERPPTNQRLDSLQEQALCQYIDALDKLGLSPRRDQIATAANSILQEAYPKDQTKPPTLGDHWLRRFLQRHPEYHIRRKRAMDIERKRAHDKSTIQAWFQSYHDTIAQYGIAHQDIYNFDETGFQIGVGRDQWIITREPRIKIFGNNTTNRESVTVIEAISVDGFVIPPLIILSARQALLRWFDNIEEERLAISDTGFANDLLAYQWIQHFHWSTIARTSGPYRLLICDNFGSHLTYEFIQFCEKNRIIPFFLPSHTSHLLQPLDVGVFNVYKHWHAEAIEAVTMTGCQKLTKDEFLYALATIRTKTFKLSTIQLGFRLTGLWPYNPSMVTSR
jgi:hypothetical protein